MNQVFPKDMLDSMRTCILSILWKKDDIVSFFKDNQCDRKDLARVGNTAELTRVRIVDYVFEDLNKRPDSGIGQFRSMLKSLINWSHFDPYYFDVLGKLSREEAERQINHLRQLQEIRDTKTKEIRRNKQEKEQKNTLEKKKEEIRNIYLKLFYGKDDNGKYTDNLKRGYCAEDFLKKVYEADSKLTQSKFIHDIQSELVRGKFKFEGENYILQLKWQDKQEISNSLYIFSQKVEGQIKMNGRGIFISINGYETDSVRILKSVKATKTILINGEDFVPVIEGRLSLSELLDKKIIAAQTEGEIYYDVARRIPKC